MADNFRFYSFVAGLYLSPLQCGLQTAHAVSEMSIKYSDRLSAHAGGTRRERYTEWAIDNKTIIILNALNSGGVKDVYTKLYALADQLHLPVVIFHEDEMSLGGAATAAGVIVPRDFFASTLVEGKWAKDATGKYDTPTYYEYVLQPDEGDAVSVQFLEGTVEFEFIKLIKSYPKA